MDRSNKGWIVTAAGVGLNLALGILYAWSVFAKNLTENPNWLLSKTEASLPYTVAIAIFAIVMVPAGRLQDKIGPRWVATLGGALTGIGMIIAGLSHSLTGLVIGFGVLAGTGLGLGYASATPAAVKWFPPQKKGLITGLVVSGFGLASVYIAPLTKYLIGSTGIEQAFVILGVAFLITSVLLSQLLTNPPAGYKPVGVPTSPAVAANTPAAKRDYEWIEMLKTPQFYFLWIMFALGSSAGLMIIGHLSKIAKVQLNIEWGFALVAFLAVFNAGGRIIAGIVSDKIGRTRTMFLVFMFQAIVMFLFTKIDSSAALALGAVSVGFNYGALLSLFPTTTADYFGTKNLGVNYGLVFTAWGVGGVFGPIMAGMIADATGNYFNAYLISAILCAVAGGLTFLTKSPKTIMVIQSKSVKA